MNSNEKNKQIEAAQEIVSGIAEILKVSSVAYSVDQDHGPEKRSITHVDVRQDINPLLSAVCQFVTLTPNVARILKTEIITFQRKESAITEQGVETTPHGIEIENLSIYLKCKNPVTAMESLARELDSSNKGFRETFPHNEREYKALWELNNLKVFFFDL